MRSRLRHRTAARSDSDSEALEAQRAEVGGGRRKGGGGTAAASGRSASESSARERASLLPRASADDAEAEGAMEGSSSFLKDSGISDVVTNSPDENSAADGESRVRFGAESRRSGAAGER